MGGGGKESHRDSSLSARRRQKDGTREGSKRRKRREQRAISQMQRKRMSNAGGTPPPTTPLYRQRAGGPAPATQRSPPEDSPAAQRSPPENSPTAQRSPPKKSQGMQRKLTRQKRPRRRATARFAAQRLLSKTPMNVASAPVDAFGQYGLRPRGRLWPRRFELTACSGEPWSQKGGTVVTRLRRVTKASDSKVSPRRLRPSQGGNPTLTKGNFPAILEGC